MYLNKLIQIPIFSELKNLPVMICVFTEFAGAFQDYGCKINIVNSINNLEDGGIILLDDAAGEYIINSNIYNNIAKKCPNSIFICWYWEKQPYFKPFDKVIYTGEYNINNNYVNEHRLNYFNLKDFVPLRLRANDSPDMIGKYSRNDVRDYCFMGGGYKIDWLPSEFTGLYHQVYSTNYIPYNQRREIYLSSTFAFAFQSDENIKMGHLSQRVFEGLAYGCIVLCENKLASDFTDGAVVYVSSKHDLVEKMKFYKQNPELMKEKIEQGYTWVKKFGTNRYSVKFFLEKIKELYDYEFEL
jgi:spore maturation protein CgeB